MTLSPLYRRPSKFYFQAWPWSWEAHSNIKRAARRVPAEAQKHTKYTRICKSHSLFPSEPLTTLNLRNNGCSVLTLTWYKPHNAHCKPKDPTPRPLWPSPLPTPFYPSMYFLEHSTAQIVPFFQLQDSMFLLCFLKPKSSSLAGISPHYPTCVLSGLTSCPHPFMVLFHSVLHAAWTLWDNSVWTDHSQKRKQ